MRIIWRRILSAIWRDRVLHGGRGSFIGNIDWRSATAVGSGSGLSVKGPIGGHPQRYPVPWAVAGKPDRMIGGQENGRPQADTPDIPGVSCWTRLPSHASRRPRQIILIATLRTATNDRKRLGHGTSCKRLGPFGKSMFVRTTGGLVPVVDERVKFCRPAVATPREDRIACVRRARFETTGV